MHAEANQKEREQFQQTVHGNIVRVSTQTRKVFHFVVSGDFHTDLP